MGGHDGRHRGGALHRRTAGTRRGLARLHDHGRRVASAGLRDVLRDRARQRPLGRQDRAMAPGRLARPRDRLGHRSRVLGARLRHRRRGRRDGLGVRRAGVERGDPLDRARQSRLAGGGMQARLGQPRARTPAGAVRVHAHRHLGADAGTVARAPRAGAGRQRRSRARRTGRRRQTAVARRTGDTSARSRCGSRPRTAARSCRARNKCAETHRSGNRCASRAPDRSPARCGSGLSMLYTVSPLEERMPAP